MEKAEQGVIPRRETKHGRISSHTSSPDVSILLHRVLAEHTPLVKSMFSFWGREIAPRLWLIRH